MILALFAMYERYINYATNYQTNHNIKIIRITNGQPIHNDYL